MVFEGTKIYVVSSSERGKGNKIRRGSLGYLSGVGTQSSVGKNTLITIVPAKVVFTRFGFQNKERSESKLVHLVFPIQWQRGMTNPLSHLDKLTKMAEGVRPDIQNVLASLSGHSRITGSIGHNIKSTKLPAIIVKEACSDITSSECEFKSWLKSVLSSPIMNNVIRSNNKTKIHRVYKILKRTNPEFKSAFINVKLNTLIDDIYNLDKQRQDILINSLRCILNLYKSSVINSASSIDNCFMSVSEIDRRSYPLHWQVGQINDYFRKAPSKYYHINSRHRDSINMWLKFLENISI